MGTASNTSAVVDLINEERIPASKLCAAISTGLRAADDDFVRAVRDALEERIDSLEHEPDLHGRALGDWRRRRGYRLEELLVGHMALEGLRPAPPFRPKGEQIDALFELNGRYFLVEAKWTQKELPASDLYEFRGKVEGKLHGTIGIFVSMAGFSVDAAKALAKGKTVQVLLVDGDDVRSVFEGDVTWSTLIDEKCRAAAQRGMLYYSWRQKKDLDNA